MNKLLIIGIGIFLFFIVFLYFSKKGKENVMNIFTKVLFRKKGTIFFHEDDYCQVEIVPKENMSDLIKEAENIEDFSTEYGFSDIYIRNEHSINLSQRKIKITELENILSKLEVIKHTDVMTGYGNDYRVISEKTIGFGKNYSAIYFDYENGVVKNIWVSNFFEFNQDKLTDVLLEIGKKWNLVLMDWNSSELIDLSNKEMIRKYLNSKK